MLLSEDNEGQLGKLQSRFGFLGQRGSMGHLNLSAIAYYNPRIASSKIINAKYDYLVFRYNPYMRNVIGLVGPISSGKGTVAQILKDRGFICFSLSDRIRDEAERRGLDIGDTKILQDLRDELRAKFGADILAKRTYRRVNMAEGSKIVIDSIRNPAEIRFLKEKLDIIILGVEASPETRYLHYLQRGRETKPKSWEEFLEMDRRETMSSGDPEKIDVTSCLSMADYRIKNEGTSDDLMEELTRVIKEISRDQYLGKERR